KASAKKSSWFLPLTLVTSTPRPRTSAPCRRKWRSKNTIPLFASTCSTRKPRSSNTWLFPQKSPVLRAFLCLLETRSGRGVVILGQGHINGNRQVIGDRITDHARITHLQGRTDQNMIQGLFRPPARKGMGGARQGNQIGIFQGCFREQILGMVIHVAHQDHVPIIL